MSFDRLIAVGIAGEHDRCDLPLGVGKGFPKKVRGIALYQNLRFKIQAGGIAPVLVAISSVTVEAAMFAARIGIHRVGKRDVWALYEIDDAGGKNLNVSRGGFFGGYFNLPLVAPGVKAVLGITLSATLGFHRTKDRRDGMRGLCTDFPQWGGGLEGDRSESAISQYS